MEKILYLKWIFDALFTSETLLAQRLAMCRTISSADLQRLSQVIVRS